jgi:hypothetical protein
MPTPLATRPLHFLSFSSARPPCLPAAVRHKKKTFLFPPSPLSLSEPSLSHPPPLPFRLQPPKSPKPKASCPAPPIPALLSLTLPAKPAQPEPAQVNPPSPFFQSSFRQLLALQTTRIFSTGANPYPCFPHLQQQQHMRGRPLKLLYYSGAACTDT